jgi:hypothetical protein
VREEKEEGGRKGRERQRERERGKGKKDRQAWTG